MCSTAKEKRDPHRLAEIQIGIASTLLLASLTYDPLPAQAQAADCPPKKVGSLPAGAIVSPPQSGVKLLEYIFQRVRSEPQIAMKQNVPQQQQLMIAQDQGPTDYRLAIRPKQAIPSKNVASPAPSLQIVSSALPRSNYGLLGGGTFGQAPGAASSAPAEMNFVDNYAGSTFKPTSPTIPQTGKGMWEAAPATEVAEPEQQLAGAGGNYIAGVTKSSPRDSRVAFQIARPSAPQSLASSMGKLSDLQAKLETARQIAAATNRNGSPVIQDKESSRAENTSTRKAQSGTRLDSFVASNNADAIYGDEGVSVSNADFDGAAATVRNAGGRGAPRRRAANEMTTGEFKQGYVGNKKAKEKAGADSSLEERESLRWSNSPRSQHQIAMSKDVIALLPPNVVTGIPLIRLGISERQANTNLAPIGSLKNQDVKDWRVATWHKPASKHTTALQLYMRNGLLDAMRIFDPTLIAPDFGVSLGDSLATVKEKFGEPAFILGEPTPGAGQNYIYPISQVGFQLARPAPGQPPKVVSVLIFNVK